MGAFLLGLMLGGAIGYALAGYLLEDDDDHYDDWDDWRHYYD